MSAMKTHQRRWLIGCARLALVASVMYVYVIVRFHSKIHSLINSSSSASSSYSKPQPALDATATLPRSFSPSHYACSNASIQSYHRILAAAKLPVIPSTHSCNCFLLLHSKPSESSYICLPTFFVIGVSKSGTSSLYYYLTQDNRFVAAKTKETWHTFVPFADALKSDMGPVQKSRRLRQYLNNFIYNGDFRLVDDVDMSYFEFNARNSLSTLENLVLRTSTKLNISVPVSASLFRNSTNTRVKISGVSSKYLLMTGDGTPEYHFYADIPEQLYEWFPTARILVLGRDPLERAISSHSFCGLSKIYGDKSATNFTLFAYIASLHVQQIAECRLLNATKDMFPETNQQWTLHTRGVNRSHFFPNPKHTPLHATHKNYEKLRRNLANITQNPCAFQPYIGNHNNFFGRSEIATHVQWWSHFYPSDQILAIDYSLLHAGTTYRVYKEALDFLGFPTPSIFMNNSLFSVQFLGPVEVKYDGYDHYSWHTLKWSILSIFHTCQEWFTSSEEDAIVWDILKKPFIRRFDPGTVSVADVRRVLGLFKEFNLSNEFDKIEAHGVRVVR